MAGSLYVCMQPPLSLRNKLIELPECDKSLDKLHITITFHGSFNNTEKGRSKLETLCNIVQRVANTYSPIRVTLDGYTIKGRMGDKLAVTVDDMYDSKLHFIHRDIVDACHRANVWRSDDWAYQPHITIGPNDGITAFDMTLPASILTPFTLDALMVIPSSFEQAHTFQLRG